jgi:hypothetical protein
VNTNPHKTCQDCAFARCASDDGHVVTLVCCAMPPVVVVLKDKLTTTRPMVDDADPACRMFVQAKP